MYPIIPELFFQKSLPYNGLFSLGQIFAKRWIFALEINFLLVKSSRPIIYVIFPMTVPGRFFRFLLHQQQSYQAKTGVSEFITLRYVRG